MADSSLTLLRRHGALSALAVAALFAVGVLVTTLVVTGAGFLGFPLDQISDIVSLLAWSALPAACLGVGFFLSLWLLAPIAGELRLGHVITRTVLALGIGVTIFFVVSLLAALIGSLSAPGPLFGNSFAWPQYSWDMFFLLLRSSFTSAIVLFVQTLPLAVLTGIFFWMWRKEHPPTNPVAGILDV